MMTCLINGTTIAALYHKLDIYTKRDAHELLLHRALCQAELFSENQIENMKNHWFFHNLDYRPLQQMLPKLSGVFTEQNGKMRIDTTQCKEENFKQPDEDRLTSQLKVRC